MTAKLPVLEYFIIINDGNINFHLNLYHVDLGTLSLRITYDTYRDFMLAQRHRCPYQPFEPVFNSRAYILVAC